MPKNEPKPEKSGEGRDARKDYAKPRLSKHGPLNQVVSAFKP
jgi:hypothetical protein